MRHLLIFRSIIYNSTVLDNFKGSLIMPITEYLEANAKKYPNDCALVELNRISLIGAKSVGVFLMKRLTAVHITFWNAAFIAVTKSAFL